MIDKFEPQNETERKLLRELEAIDRKHEADKMVRDHLFQVRMDMMEWERKYVDWAAKSAISSLNGIAIVVIGGFAAIILGFILAWFK